MSPDRSELLALAGVVLAMMIVLAVLKHLARARATAARAAQRRLIAKAEREGRSEPAPGP